MSFFRRHYFSILIITLLILLTAASYYRFMFLEDYLVSYEIDCDPAAEYCFEGCDDDACEETYYYSMIERHASTLKNLCGPNVLKCELANGCQPNEDKCSITQCDPTNPEDECLYLNET